MATSNQQSTQGSHIMKIVVYVIGAVLMLFLSSTYYKVDRLVETVNQIKVDQQSQYSALNVALERMLGDDRVQDEKIKDLDDRVSRLEKMWEKEERP